jgi:hypothetical protein
MKLFKRKWKSKFIRILDFDDSGEIDWWEWIIAILFILGIEVAAELIAYLLVGQGRY